MLLNGFRIDASEPYCFATRSVIARYCASELCPCRSSHVVKAHGTSSNAVLIIYDLETNARRPAFVVHPWILRIA